jgi:hypothetical protein
MLFVVNKQELQRAIRLVRDDRTKKSWGLAGPFMRLEAKNDHIKVEGVAAFVIIPATVYEPGVLFLKVTAFRRLLGTFKGEKFLAIQVMADGLLLDNVRLPLEENEMLLYAVPDQAPKLHPSLTLSPPVSKPKPEYRQLLLWNEELEFENE